MACKVCGLEVLEQSLVVVEMVSPRLSGDGEVRLLLPFCPRCWQPDRFNERKPAFDAARREAITAGADASSKTWKVVSFPHPWRRPPLGMAF